MGKRIGEDRIQVGDQRSHRDIADEAVKRVKNADIPSHSFRMRKEQARNTGKRETSIPIMGQGLAEETKASHLCNGCGKRLGFVALFMLQARGLLR
jgi:hypothetical protein